MTKLIIQSTEIQSPHIKFKLTNENIRNLGPAQGMGVKGNVATLGLIQNFELEDPTFSEQSGGLITDPATEYAVAIKDSVSKKTGNLDVMSAALIEDPNFNKRVILKPTNLWPGGIYHDFNNSSNLLYLAYDHTANIAAEVIFKYDPAGEEPNEEVKFLLQPGLDNQIIKVINDDQNVSQFFTKHGIMVSPAYRDEGPDITLGNILNITFQGSGWLRVLVKPVVLTDSVELAFPVITTESKIIASDPTYGNYGYITLESHTTSPYASLPGLTLPYIKFETNPLFTGFVTGHMRYEGRHGTEFQNFSVRVSDADPADIDHILRNNGYYLVEKLRISQEGKFELIDKRRGNEFELYVTAIDFPEFIHEDGSTNYRIRPNNLVFTIKGNQK